MRRWARLAALVLLGLVCAPVSSIAQTTAQQSVTVVVLNALPQPPQPVKAVRVSLSYLQSSVLVTDAQEVTNSQGQALLLVSPGVAQRGGLRIDVTGATDLVIYQPADGQLAGLPPNIRVTLLPKGSPALLGPAQIEALLHRSLLQVSSLQKQLAAQKQNSASTQNQAPDLGPALATWAQANGFSSTQVDQQVQLWAQKVQSQPAQATSDQKALAELALKHYANAAQLFSQASDVDRQAISAGEAQEQSLEAQVQALQAAQRAVLDKLRAPLRQLLDHSEQAAGAYQLNSQFHEATQTLQSATDTADSEYKKHPADKGFQALWLEAFAAAANARWQEGKVAPASESFPLLAQSATDFQTLSQQYDNIGDRASWAWAQDGLGIALMNEAIRSSGDKALPLFDQSVQAFQNALTFYTKANTPAGWASTQNNLGNVLDDESIHTADDKAVALLAQSVEAYKNVLEVNTRTSAPQEWALTQSNLGAVLDDEGNKVAGDSGIALLNQAIETDHQALEVSTRAEHPLDWAMTQNNLGIALMDLGRRVENDKGGALMAQAVEAFHNALQVFTEASVPQDWATVLNNLGFALKDQARRATGDDASALYEQSLKAYEQALQVRTKTDLPRAWADSQYNMGNVLQAEAEASSGDKASALLAQAVEAFQNSLQVYTRDYPPKSWADAQYALGNTYVDQSTTASADQSAALLAQAAQAFQNALQVYTVANQPQDWSNVHAAMGLVDKLEGKYDAAAAEYELALQPDPNSLFVLKRVSTLYHENLFRFDVAFTDDDHRVQLNPSPDNKMDLLEADLTASEFDACIRQAATLADSQLTPSQIVVRNALSFACQVASGNQSGALAAAKTLASTASTMQKEAWTFTGTLHFLSDAPAFEKDRASWIALFKAIQNADNAGVAAALQQLQPLLRN